MLDCSGRSGHLVSCQVLEERLSAVSLLCMAFIMSWHIPARGLYHEQMLNFARCFVVYWDDPVVPILHPVSVACLARVPLNVLVMGSAEWPPCPRVTTVPGVSRPAAAGTGPAWGGGCRGGGERGGESEVREAMPLSRKTRKKVDQGIWDLLPTIQRMVV